MQDPTEVNGITKKTSLERPCTLQLYYYTQFSEQKIIPITVL